MSNREGLVLDGLDLNAGAGATVAGSTPYHDAVITDSPVAYYRLAEPSGTTATDIGSGAHNGTYVNSPTLGAASPVSDVGDTAATFTAASSQRVDAASPTAATNDWTLECWVKLASTANQDAMFAVNGGDRTSAAGWGIAIRNAGVSTDSAGLSLAGLFPGVAWVSTSYVFADTNWHHIVFVRRSGTAEMYVDGSAVTVTANSTAVPLAPSTSFTIAADHASDSTFQRYFNGSVDEVAVYTTALSAARIAAHYAARTGAAAAPGQFILQGFECPPPAKRQEWAQGADSDGALLVRDPLFDNREITVRLRVAQQTTMDDALTQISLLSKKLEEAEQQPDGLALVWTPAGSTKSITFYVLSGVVDGLPISLTGDDAGWFLRSPVITLRLQCKPFGYGTPVTSSTTSSATPFVTATIASVPGDVPAEGRLLATDGAGQNRRYVEWGLEQRYFDPATSLLVDSDDMVTSGFAGAQTAGSGYDPNASGANVIRTTLYPGALTALCGTGNLSHVGTFRVKCRLSATDLAVKARLTWQEGDGPFRSNPYASIPAVTSAGFVEVDLGLITIPPKQLGTQRWQGRIEAIWASANAGSQTIDIDYLILVPAGEGYGKVRAQYAYSTGALTGTDDFSSLGAGGALNARTAPLGGSWTSDAAITGASGGGAVTSSGSGKIARLGSAITDTEVSALMTLSGSSGTHGVVARYVDASNYLRAVMAWVSGAKGYTLKIEKVIAGVATTIATTPSLISPPSPATVRLIVWASGQAIATVLDSGGAQRATCTAQDTTLATAGTLASGTPGLYMEISSVADNFSVSTPATEVIAIYSGRTAEIRYDGAIRQNSTGTYYGPVPAYRGSRFLVPPAGDENRTSRILVKAHRNDIEAAAAPNVTDNLTIQTIITPRYVVVPF